MINQTKFTLINPRTRLLAFQLCALEDSAAFGEIQRNQYYTVILVTHGKGILHVGLNSTEFKAGSLLCLSLYDPYRIEADFFKGTIIEFHPEFFCIYKHEEEVACNGVLFNSIYQSPVVGLRDDEAITFQNLIDSLRSEMQKTGISQYEMLTAYLKIFLINAVRIKMTQEKIEIPTGKEPFILQTLKDAIEENYRQKRSPVEYADLLNITPKALNRISKKHLNRTLSDLISERIVIEAKRELYLTGKPVKQIAYELGFNDEFYFSRFFKTNVSVSPQLYRETVGYAKGEGI